MGRVPPAALALAAGADVLLHDAFALPGELAAAPVPVTVGAEGTVLEL